MVARPAAARPCSYPSENATSSRPLPGGDGSAGHALPSSPRTRLTVSGPAARVNARPAGAAGAGFRVRYSAAGGARDWRRQPGCGENPRGVEPSRSLETTHGGFRDVEGSGADRKSGSADAAVRAPRARGARDEQLEGLGACGGRGLSSRSSRCFAATVLAGAAVAAAPSTLVPDAQSGRDAVASTLRAIGELGDANAPGATGAPRREGFAAAGLPTISAPPDVIVSEGGIDHTIDLVVKLSAAPIDTVLVSASTASTTANSGTSCGSTDADYVAISTPQQLQFPAGIAPDRGARVRDDQGLPVRRGSRVVQARAQQRRRTRRSPGRARSSASSTTHPSSRTPRLFVRDATVDEKDGSVLVPVLLGNTARPGVEQHRHRQLRDERRHGDAPGPTTRRRAARSPSRPARRPRPSSCRSSTPGRSRSKSFTLTLSGADATRRSPTRRGSSRSARAPRPRSRSRPCSAPPDMVVGEGDGYVDLAVRLSAPGTNPVTVNYATANSTANSGDSCGDDARLRRRPAGRSPSRRGETTKVVRVQLLDCTDVEGLVSFRFNLSAPANATIARASTLVSIVNNDTVGRRRRSCSCATRSSTRRTASCSCRCCWAARAARSRRATS